MRPPLVTPLLRLLITVLCAALPARTVVAQPVRALVRGEVLDSIRMRVLPGATVQLVATDSTKRILAAVTNAQGLFQIDEVPPGVYLAGFLHPLLDSLGIESTLLRLDVTGGDPLTIAMGTPSATTLIEARCGAPTAELPPGLFFGTVRRADGRTLESTGARVRAQYTTVRVNERRAMERVPNVRVSSVTPEGTFAVCGVPPNGVITVRAVADADSSGFVELAVPGNGVLVRDLFVGTALRSASTSARASAVLKGAAALRGVARTQSGVPAAGARITLWGTGREIVANAAGQYNADSLPEGSYTIEARALGYQPHRAAVDLAAGQPAVVDLTLTPLVTTVDTMRVRANRAVPLEEFERRRKLGFGHFITEDEIRTKAPTYMGDIFRGTPGIVTMAGQFGRDRVLVRGTGMTGDCAPAVFLNGMLVNIEDGDLDVIINPKDVRAVEIYARTSSIPVQFQTRNGCGSTVIWTGARTEEARKR
jgi:hypothetical protein